MRENTYIFFTHLKGKGNPYNANSHSQAEDRPLRRLRRRRVYAGADKGGQERVCIVPGRPGQLRIGGDGDANSTVNTTGGPGKHEEEAVRYQAANEEGDTQ